MNVLGIIIASLLAAPDAPVASLPAKVLAVSSQFLTVTEEQLDRLLQELTHPRFAVREEATRQLATLDPRYLPALAQRYRTDVGYEMKRRVRFAVESIFYRSQVTGREGFLGIRIARELDQSVADPQTGVRTRGVVVIEALEGLPAGRAGLRPDDVILSMDGRRLPDDPTSRSFQEAIASRPPGCTVQLRVLRPGKTRREIPLLVGDDPMQRVREVTFGAPPLGVPTGPRIMKVVPGSEVARAGARVNDIIVSINGRSLMTSRGPLAFAQLLEVAQAGDRYILGVAPAEEVTLDVTLGARPTKYLETLDKAKAQARFVRWWQDQGGHLLLPPLARPVMVIQGQGEQPPLPAIDAAIIP